MKNTLDNVKKLLEGLRRGMARENAAFEMSFFRDENHSCGTAHCVLGHAVNEGFFHCPIKPGKMSFHFDCSYAQTVIEGAAQKELPFGSELIQSIVGGTHQIRMGCARDFFARMKNIKFNPSMFKHLNEDSSTPEGAKAAIAYMKWIIRTLEVEIKRQEEGKANA